jgi:glycosyltransferase involved in cell wall biosynthesis
MKVAIATNRIASRAPTGVERYARELAMALHARTDVRCQIVAPKEPGEATWSPPGLSAVHVPYPRRATIAMWCTVRRPRLDRFLHDAELVHVAAPTFPMPAAVPTVHTVHDVLPLTNPEWFTPRNRFGFHLGIREVRRRAAAIIADSNATADGLVQLGVERPRITVVPLGVGARFLEGASTAEASSAAHSFGVEPNGFVLHVGDFSPRKNVAVLVEAIARMARPIPLLLAGPEGRGAALVRQDAERLNVGGLVRFLDFVPDATLVPLIAAARAVVHPSRAEGFGLTPLEAMAVGTPAIVASTAALPDAVAGAAVVQDPDEPEAWTAAIEAFADMDHRDATGAQGRVAASAFTWSHTADRTVAVYRDVLANST